MDESDVDVLGRARAGDERAFLALYRAAQPDLLRYLSVLVGDDAEIVAAATWEVVTHDLRLFAGTLEGFRGWVAGVGRRLALEHLARSKSLSDPEIAGEVIPSRAAGALRLIASLPEEQAEAVALRTVMRLDEEASAGVLGVRTAELRRRARQGLIKMAERLRVSTWAQPQPIESSQSTQVPVATVAPVTVTLPEALLSARRHVEIPVPAHTVAATGTHGRPAHGDVAPGPICPPRQLGGEAPLKSLASAHGSGQKSSHRS